MGDEAEVSLKTVCCTCLNTDRKLQKLCRISEGVNLLYLLLSCDPDAYKEIFYKDSTCLQLCWECVAIMKRIRLFQVQASRAIRELNDFCNTSGTNFKSLSNLSTHIQKTNESIIQDSEYFVDCGSYINTELDLDDIPLSKLRNNQTNTSKTITRMKGHKKQAHKTITKPIYLKNMEKDYENVSNSIHDIPECPKSPLNHNRKGQSPIESYKEAYKSVTEPIKLKKYYENESDLIDDMPERLNSPLNHYKKAKNPIENYEQAHKPIIKPIDLRNKERSTKCYKKKKYNFSGSKKKRKKNTFSEIKLKCPECNLCFENKNTRWKHIQKLHREGYQCSICEKRFALKSNLQRHEKNHSSPPPREQCPTCDKSVRVDLMQAHSLTHTDRQKYACITCDKTFVCRDTYHSHLRYSRAHCESDALARYKCSTCDKCYRSQAELKDHINYQHKGQTEHKCPICGKGLATKRCIRRHVRRAHEGIKENARDKMCQRCGKAFRDKKSLREHEYIHTGERPLSCELCGQTFRQYASLYTHKKRVHKLIVPQKTVTVLNNDCSEGTVIYSKGQ